jgi:hypothetical protein
MKRTRLLQRLLRITTTVLVTLVVLACATVVNAAEEKPDDRWRFTIIPYLWLPSVSGSMKLNLPSGPGSGSVDISSSNYLDNLQFAGMLDIQAEKGRWSFLFDIMYVDFSDDNRAAYFPGVFPASGGWAITADTELQALVSEFVVGYSVFRNEFMNFDLFAGVRYAGIDGKASLDVFGPLPAGVRSRTFSDSVDFIDPIVGFKGKFELGKRWFFPYYFDIGGLDSDFTLQAFGGIGYRFCDWFSMTLGYRYLYYDFGGSKLVKDMSLSGGQLGFVFTF